MTTVEDRTFLPDLLREIKDAWDMDTALRFADHFGGRVVYLPREAKTDHPLAETMGEPFMQWADRPARRRRSTGCSLGAAIQLP